jgi:hypothetical protein
MKFEECCEDVEWIQVTEDRVQWYLVNTVMNLGFHKSRKFLDQLSNFTVEVVVL